MPDFDLDFCCKRRGEVIEYVTQKYGADHICQIVTFGTMAAKSAIKDIARVFDVPYSEVEKITKPIEITQTQKPPYLQYIFGLKDIKKPDKDTPEEEQEKYKKEKKKAEELLKPELADLYRTDEQVQRIVDMAIKVEGFPRNCSVHAAGVIICKEIVGNVCPLAKNGDSVTSQYDMKEVEELGFLKMDFLGLITCTDIDGAIKDIKKQLNKDIDFYDMEYNDTNVYKMISAGDTDAVFQLESGGMKRFMKDLRPDKFEDIIAGVALFRPGPMDMIPNYCRNKHNPRLTIYDHPTLENILRETYGQIVYQEQVMEIFKQLGGYSLGQADMVRRAMGKKKVAEMAKQKKIFINGDKAMNIAGAVSNGVPKDVAGNIFAKMEKFAGYAFNKSHAACYAFLSYQTAFLKYYYYSFFMASMLNNRISKWDDMTHYIAEMRVKNTQILPPDINRSGSLFSVELNKDDKNNPFQPVRFGLSAIKNVGEGVVNQIIAERDKNGDYRDFIDFCRRVPTEALNKRCLESLILSGSFDNLGLYRSQLMVIYPTVVKLVSGERSAYESGQVSMFGLDSATNVNIDVQIPKLPEYSNFDKLRFEREFVGLYLSGHPLNDYAELFGQFSFNTDNLGKRKTDDGGEQPDTAPPPTEFESAGGGDDEFDPTPKKPELAVFGAIINNIKKIYTRANHDEMAILSVEDLYGACEVMVFPKIWANVKNTVPKDTVVKITGRVSNRDGQVPIILCENIEPMPKQSATSPQSLISPVGVSPDVKKLYLRFNLGDEQLKTDVMTVLSSYSGDLSVVIRDTSTGKTVSPKLCVRECRAIIYELNSILCEENVVLK
jgi:DNA polymerase-3 subunit alpha